MGPNPSIHNSHTVPVDDFRSGYEVINPPEREISAPYAQSAVFLLLPSSNAPNGRDLVDRSPFSRFSFLSLYLKSF